MPEGKSLEFLEFCLQEASGSSLESLLEAEVPGSTERWIWSWFLPQGGECCD